MIKHRGVDMSSGNSVCDFNKMKKAGVEFVIIRLGWGQDQTNQDDARWKEYAEGCEKAGIPYGLYLYSYALDLDMVDGEIKHALRVAKATNPTLGVWFDMEDADQYKKNHGINVYKSRELLTNMCTKFCDAMKKEGYQTGIYASLDYFRNVLTPKAQEKYNTWVACWSINEPTSVKNMVMWQNAGSESRRKYDGMGGYGADLDYWYGDFNIKNTEKEKPKDSVYDGPKIKLPDRGYFTKGDKGANVLNLQKFLLWYGCSLPLYGADGSLGNETMSAVKEFQTKENIKIDGYFGVQSYEKYVKYIK